MTHDDNPPSAIGLLRCLQMLADEAACIGLTRTFAALQQAIDACRAESARSTRQLWPVIDPILLH